MKERIVVAPSKIRSGTMQTLIKRLVTGRYDRNSITHQNYTGHMVYDGYSVKMDIYAGTEHIASWDSLPGRLTYYTKDKLKVVGNIVHAITLLGYELKHVVVEEGQDIPTFKNWPDFIATPAERGEVHETL